MKSKLLSVLAAVLAFGLLTGLVVADIANSTGKLGPTLGGGTGGGTPGGSTTEIQFNNAGAFGGDSDFTYNSTTNTVGVGRVLASGTFTGANPQFSSSAATADGLAFGSGNVSLYATAAVQLISNGSALLTVDNGNTILNGSAVGGANKVWLSSASGSISWEGTTADADEFVLAVGDPTEDRTLTITAGTDTTLAMDTGRFSFGNKVKIGTAPWTTETGSVDLEFVVISTDAALEGHFEGGTDVTYAGIGIRNNRLTGSGLTLAGGLFVTYGSAHASTFGGKSLADLTVLANAGANSTGLAIGTTTIDPLLFFVQTATGSEPRMLFGSGCATLSDDVSGNFVQINVPSGSVTGGTIHYTMYAFAGGVLQTNSGITIFSAVNTAGTEACSIGNATGVSFMEIQGVGSGTLPITSFTDDDGSTTADACTFAVRANSSLSTPTMAMCYQVIKNAGIGAIVPL